MVHSPRPSALRIPRRLAIVCLALTAVHVVEGAGTALPARAFRVAPASMASEATIRRVLSSAAAAGFDTAVIPLITGARSESERANGEDATVRLARELGLGVQVAIAVNLAAAVDEIPAEREHVVYQHPEWLMVPRQIAAELFDVDVRSPGYFGRIARWTRANAGRVDGVYVSPLDPGATAYLVATVAEAAARHHADGVYLEAIDFPGIDFDYGRRAIDLFRTSVRARLPADERARLDHTETIDPFAYAEEFAAEWRRFREAALTALIEQLRAALSTADPDLAITVAARAAEATALDEHFQDWRGWLDRGVIDRVGFLTRSTGEVSFSADGRVRLDSRGPSGSTTATETR